MRMFCLIALIGAPTAVALQPPTRQPWLNILYLYLSISYHPRAA